jgi:PTH2 family peptidyl-tRNA hydrolase
MDSSSTALSSSAQAASLAGVAGVAIASFLAGWAAAKLTVKATARSSLSASAAPSSNPAPAPAPASTPSPLPNPSSSASIRKTTAKDVEAAEEAEEEAIEDSEVLDEEIELKMVMCVRQDLNMSKGKIAAQCGHAALGAYKLCRRLQPEYVKAWEFRAQAKITLKVDDEPTMDKIAQAAREAGLACVVIEDAGRTEVEPGTRTVLAIGPAPKAEIDALTGPKGRFPLRLLT